MHSFLPAEPDRLVIHFDQEYCSGKCLHQGLCGDRPSINLRTRVFLLVIVTALLATSMNGESTAAGLYQYGVWQTNDKILASSFVDGVVVYVGWSALEPTQDAVDVSFIKAVRTRAKELGKKLIIRIVSAELTPPWVYRLGIPRVLDTTDHDPRWVPLYWHPKYLGVLDEFIGKISAQLDGDPVIEAVQVGIGRYGEMCLEGFDWLNHDFSPKLWTATCISILDIYKKHFRKTPLLVMIMSADLPGGRWTSPMQEVASYAAANGIGIQFNGLSPDNSYLWGLRGQPDEDSAVGIFRKYAGKVPLAFELTNDKVDARLSCMNAVSEHASFLFVHTSLLADPELRGIFAFTHYFLGRSLRSSDAVWTLLRQTNPDSVEETGKKNYEFGLKQIEFPTDTKFVVDKQQISVTTKTMPLDDFLGLPCRRTVDSDQQAYLAFQIDGEVNLGSKPTLSVIFADVGMDSWSLFYMTQDGLRKFGTVHKQDTRQWLIVDFELPGLSTGHVADILIDSNGDGDEYIHYLQLNRAGMAAPLPISLPHISYSPSARRPE